MFSWLRSKRNMLYVCRSTTWSVQLWKLFLSTQVEQKSIGLGNIFAACHKAYSQGPFKIRAIKRQIQTVACWSFQCNQRCLRLDWACKWLLIKEAGFVPTWEGALPQSSHTEQEIQKKTNVHDVKLSVWVGWADRIWLTSITKMTGCVLWECSFLSLNSQPM